jgi:glycosyltransferase involved in cell wall biosynthesis
MHHQQPLIQDDRVSVVIPAFDAEATLADTLRSVLAQTYPQVEILVVDDGSHDRTAALATSIAEAEARVQVLTATANSGRPAVPRNRGLRAATGAFIAFLDADDLWLPGKLEKQVDYLRAHPEADAVCCWIQPIDDDGAPLPNPNRLRSAKVCARAEFLEGMPLFTSTLLMRRTCYERIGGMDEDPRLRSVEDADYVARLLTGCTVHRIPEPLVLYRLSNRRPSLSAAEADVQNSKGWRLQEVLEEKGALSPAELRRRRAFLWYETARANLHAGHGPFRPYLLRALAAGYWNWRVPLTLALSILPRAQVSRLLVSLQNAANRKKIHRKAE